MTTRTAYRGAEKVKVRGNASSPDPDETAALDFAAASAGLSPATAIQCISAWIAKRAELSAGARLTENLAFDMGDAKLRGFVVAALPMIGSELTDKIDAGTPLFDLTKDDIVQVFSVAFQAIQDAAVSAGEAQVFIGDRVPF